MHTPTLRTADAPKRAFGAPVALVLVVFVMTVSVVGGCSALQTPPEPAIASPGNPLWNEREVREHLSFISGSSVAQRAVGTPAMEQAADYVAARMRGYRLQPGLDRYRVTYRARMNRITSADLWAVAHDSLQLQIAHDFWPDGRSDSGSVQIRHLHLSPRRFVAPIIGDRAGSPAIMIDGPASRARLDSLATAGYRAVFVVQPLAPVSATAPVPGAVVVQVTRGTAAWMLGLTRPGFDVLWDDPEPSVRSLARRIDLRVATEHAVDLPAQNVIGILAGREPVLMQDLVIVAANLDAPGTTAGERVTDHRQIGTGLSAMLEIARNEQAVSRRFTHPMRSVMFAAFSGHRSGHQGLRAFLDKPLWQHGRIRTVLYLGLSEDDEEEVRALLAPYGIELIAVRSTQSLPFERRYVFASERGARSRSPVPRTEAPPPSPESSVVNARAVDVSMDLVRQGHALLEEIAGSVRSPERRAVSSTMPIDQ